MRFDDKIWVEASTETEDEDLNVTEESTLVFMGQCKILPNGGATKTYDEDGRSFHYSRTIFVRKPSIMPKEGDSVKLYSNTSKTESTARVAGICVLPRKFVKLYLS